MLAAPAVARAEAKYPERTIRLVVPFAPAGPTDIIGRKVAEKMTAMLGQTMIVDNKAGAAGSIGAVEVKNAKPDGYTLLVATSSTHAINPTAFVHPPYDPIKDFTPIASVCVNPTVFFTHPSFPPSVMEFVELELSACVTVIALSLESSDTSVITRRLIRPSESTIGVKLSEIPNFL